MKKIIIAIDGFSSTGKSTLAKRLAKEFKYVYVDTGAMYRSVALYALEHGFITEDSFDKAGLITNLDQIAIGFKFNEDKGFAEAYLNGVNVEETIRTLRVSSFVSDVAALPEVRKKMVAQQREIGNQSGVVMDGRDIGTVVFPDAELKLFMTASAEIRAQRRYDELVAKGDTQVKFEEVLDNVVKRDELDMSREESPLIQADDAILIDNSDLDREEQFELTKKLVLEKLSA